MQNIYQKITTIALSAVFLTGLACKKIGVTHPTNDAPQGRLTAIYAALSRQYQKEGVNMSYYSPWCNLSMHAEAMPGAGAITYGFGLYAGESFNYAYRKMVEGRWEGGSNEWLYDDAFASVFRAQRMAEKLEQEYKDDVADITKGIYFQAKALRGLAYYVRYLFFGPEGLANPLGGYKSSWNMELDQILAVFQSLDDEFEEWLVVAQAEPNENKRKALLAELDEIKFSKSIYANVLGVKGMLARLYALKELGHNSVEANKYAQQVADAVKELKDDGISFGRFDILWGFDASEGASGYNRIWKDVGGEFQDFAWLKQGEDVYNPMYGRIFRQAKYDLKTSNCQDGDGNPLTNKPGCFTAFNIPFVLNGVDIKDPNILVDNFVEPTKKRFDACVEQNQCKENYAACVSANKGNDNAIAQCKVDYTACNEACYQGNEYIFISDDLTTDDIPFYPDGRSELILVRLQEMQDIIDGNFAKDRKFRDKSIFQGMINRAVAVRKMELGLDLNGVKVTFVPTNITY
jgi:hypothetical protein